MRTKFSGLQPLVVVALFTPGLLLAAPEQIGTIVTKQGLVTARNASGEERRLQRRSELYVGDTVVVEEDSFASIRMADNAHLSLGEDTEFTFDTYHFDGSARTRDSIVMRLVRGCFRTIAGKAATGTRDEYRIETPVANITAGSFHGATLMGDRLYTAAWNGSSTVSNSSGTLNLGNYGEFDFSRTMPGEAPKGMAALLPEATCEPPEALDGMLESSGVYRIEQE